MSQNTEELWESLVLHEFPNTPKEKLAEAKHNAACAWGFGEKTVMSNLYDKYVMMKRLSDTKPNKEE